MSFNLSGLISDLTGDAPTASFSDDAKTNLPDIATMAVGSSKFTRAIFNTVIGQFNFDGSDDSLTHSVRVTRDTATTWTVDTDSGDVAVLVRPDPDRHNRTQKVGYYHLPVRFTIAK